MMSTEYSSREVLKMVQELCWRLEVAQAFQLQHVTRAIRALGSVTVIIIVQYKRFEPESPSEVAQTFLTLPTVVAYCCLVSYVEVRGHGTGIAVQRLSWHGHPALCTETFFSIFHNTSVDIHDHHALLTGWPQYSPVLKSSLASMIRLNRVYNVYSTIYSVLSKQLVVSISIPVTFTHGLLFRPYDFGCTISHLHGPPAEDPC
jgi:hypothetical protein